MTAKMKAAVLVASAAWLAATVSAAAGAVNIPFDFSRNEIAVEATIKGTKLHVLLDTGVSPSVIDLARAQSLGLMIGLQSGDDISGVGSGQAAPAHPATISGLTIGGHGFAPFDTLTTDMGGLSLKYGSRLDAILGFSFFDRKVTLVDYPRHQVEILDDAHSRAPDFPACRQHWREPLRFLAGEDWPLISHVRFGNATAPVSLDTGANGPIWLLKAALQLPGLKQALANKTGTSSAGFRGSAKWDAYTLTEPIGIGPFILPPGERVTVRDEAGSLDSRVANIGNAQFAKLKVKLLLDYRDHQLALFGDCD